MFSTNSTPTSVLCPAAGKSRSVSSNSTRHADVQASSLEARLQRLFINCDSSNNKNDKATKAYVSPLSTRTDAVILSSSSSNNLKSSSATGKRTPKLLLSARRKLFVNDENDDAAAAASSSSAKNDVDGEKASAKKGKICSSGVKSPAGGSVAKRSKPKSVSTAATTRNTTWETVRVSATPLSANGGCVVVGQKISVEQLFAEESAVNALTTKHYAGGMCAVQSAPTMIPLSPVLQSLFSGGVDVAEELSVSDCVNKLTPSGPRSASMRYHLRRQQSASATLGARGPIAVSSLASLCHPASHGSMPGPSVNFTRRFTPPPSREVSSPIYAASKLYESPSARQLPMPPLDWITEATDVKLLRLQRATIDEKEHDAAVEDVVVPMTTKFFLPNSIEDATFAASSSDEEEKRSMSSTDTGVVFEMDASVGASPPPSASAKLLSLLKQSAPAADDKASDDCNSSSGCGASVSSASSSIDDELLPTAASATFVRVDPLALIAAVSAM